MQPRASLSSASHDARRFPPGSMRRSAASASFRPCLGRGSVDHLQLPGARARDQRLNERGLGHVAPIFLRHFLEHRADLEPRRIEDGRVIGLPHRLERIAAGRLGAGRARAFAQRLAVPVDRKLGRQDRPAHVGEAADEEAGGVADDMMLGLEEGDEARRPSGSSTSRKRTKACILWTSRRTSLASRSSRSSSGSARSSIACAVRPQLPQHRVEQGEALGVGMADGALGEVDEGARHGEARRPAAAAASTPNRSPRRLRPATPPLPAARPPRQGRAPRRASRRNRPPPPASRGARRSSGLRAACQMQNATSGPLRVSRTD